MSALNNDNTTFSYRTHSHAIEVGMSFKHPTDVRSMRKRGSWWANLWSVESHLFEGCGASRSKIAETLLAQTGLKLVKKILFNFSD